MLVRFMAAPSVDPVSCRMHSGVALVLFILWAVAVGAGFMGISRYAFTAGPMRAAAPDAGAALVPYRADGAVALVVFVHPRCACSRATWSELERLLVHAPETRTTVVFYEPAGAEGDWRETDLWSAARSSPYVATDVDIDGALARAVGATTSGHVVAIDASGRIIFSGGITASRAHEGPALGQRAVLDLLRGLPVQIATTPVFGCPLFEAAEAVDPAGAVQ